ncbi:MAG: flagellin FliC [Acidobacteria bacterium]|nr:flagellin FliC [Acidobacteriota bacterium]
MSSVLNNVAALGASRQLGITSQGLEKTIERLTTGKRINKASDDAAGLAISNRLGADIRVAGQARRNAGDGVSYLQVADGILEEVTNLLTRAAELAEQAATGTVSTQNRSDIDLEFQNIIRGIADIGLNTKFNGQTIFDTGTTLTVAVASFSPITVTVSSIATSATAALGMTAGTTALTTVASAQAAMPLITAAIDQVSTLRATIGATQQQLNSIANSLGIQVENFTAAYSQIRDANIADEVVALSKFQILNQSGTSALGQANQAQQQVLRLLQ